MTDDTLCIKGENNPQSLFAISALSLVIGCIILIAMCFVAGVITYDFYPMYPVGLALAILGTLFFNSSLLLGKTRSMRFITLLIVVVTGLVTFINLFDSSMLTITVFSFIAVPVAVIAVHAHIRKEFPRFWGNTDPVICSFLTTGLLYALFFSTGFFSKSGIYGMICAMGLVMVGAVGMFFVIRSVRVLAYISKEIKES